MPQYMLLLYDSPAAVQHFRSMSPEEMQKLAQQMPGGLPGMPGGGALPPTMPGLPPRLPGGSGPKNPVPTPG